MDSSIDEPMPKKQKLNQKTSETDTPRNDLQAVSSTAVNESVHSNLVVSKIDFTIGEIVWAKIRGSPHWPAKIKSFPKDRTATVVWFNDYRTTTIFRTQLSKFLVHFDEYSVKFDTTVGLKTAAMEALICLGQNLNANVQY